MVGLYFWDHVFFGVLLLLEISIAFYLLRDKDVSRQSRVILGLLMAAGATVGYLYASDLIKSQVNLAEVLGAAATPDALIVSTSVLQISSAVLATIFGALGIGLTVTKPS